MLQGGARVLHPDRVTLAPLLTILIVVFHDREELFKIIESILPFKSEDLEIVVVDGFSQDGTVELLEGFGENVDFWLSAPDHGIYDAMNKGLRVAAGTYILHLNAGDRLLSIPWDELRQCAADMIDVVCCRVLLDSRIEFVSRTSLLSKLDNTWHHQGTFYRRAAHLGYDASYRIAADFDHNQKLLKKSCSTRELQIIVADHDGNGVSTLEKGHEEIYRSVLRNFGWPYLLLSSGRFVLMDLRRWLRTAFCQRR